MCESRRFAKEDFQMVEDWRKKRHLPVVPMSFLPPCGAVVSIDGKDVAAGFVVKTDAGYAVLNGLVSDPDAPREHRESAVTRLLDDLMLVAKQEGFSVVSASTNLERLSQRYDKLGFTRTDKGITAFVKVI
jgi:hypothetical protein